MEGSDVLIFMVCANGNSVGIELDISIHDPVPSVARACHPSTSRFTTYETLTVATPAEARVRQLYRKSGVASNHQVLELYTSF